MRDYGQIQSTYWTNPDIQGLSDQAKLTGAYLLAGPHTTSLGCFRVPSGYIMEDLKHPLETVTQTVYELLNIGFIKYDEQSQWLLIPKFLLWNPIANPNVAKKIIKDFNLVPEKVVFYKDLIDCLKQYGKHFDNPFVNRLQTLSKQYRNIEPEPEPEPEPDPKHFSLVLSGEETIPPVIELPLNTGDEYPITKSLVDEYRSTYPAVDIEQALREMRVWLISNPTKRKTKTGILRFVNTWLGKEQNQGGKQYKQPDQFEGML